MVTVIIGLFARSFLARRVSQSRIVGCVSGSRVLFESLQILSQREGRAVTRLAVAVGEEVPGLWSGDGRL